MQEIKFHTVCYGLLLLSVGLSYVFAEKFTGLFLLAIGFTCVKFLLVSFQYVEVKHSHFAWKLVMLFYLLAYGIGLAILL